MYIYSCKRFLAALDEVLKQEKKTNADASSQSPTSTSTSSTDRNRITLPAVGPDRDALIRWAYYEATILVQQNGDLLEDVRKYMMTGTTTVGECVLLVEQTLT